MRNKTLFMIILLHNIRSLHNVGSIFRTADAAGIEKIYLCGITPAPFDEFGRLRQQLAKVSLGAEKTVPWEKIKSTQRLMDRLKNPTSGQSHKFFAIEQSKRSTPYQKIKLTGSVLDRTALIVGDEIKGLPPSILRRADKILEIPMWGKKESLNVAVAFGVVVFSLLAGVK